MVLGGVPQWMWRAANEHGEVLDVLLQEHRDVVAAKRFLKRLIDNHELLEQIVTDRLRSYSAALRKVPELDATKYVSVSDAERQNNRIKQSHRPTREQERQQQGFRIMQRTQRFLFTYAEASNLFRHTWTRMLARLRRCNLTYSFGLRTELSFAIP